MIYEQLMLLVEVLLVEECPNGRVIDWASLVGGCHSLLC